MDTPWLTGTIYGVSITTVFAVAYGFYKCVNHRQLVSKCCGHELDVSLDINDTPLAHGATPLLAAAGAPPTIHVPRPSSK